MNRFDDIRKWAEARNLLEGSTPSKQLNKLMEEIGELAHGVNKGRQEEVVDGIGDAVVVLTILAAQSGITIEECIEVAWDEIKDRKGRLIDGVWVKEQDWLMIERARQYDRPAGERSMAKTVAAFNSITGQDMTLEQGWTFMLVLKQVRFFQNPGKPHRDSIEDAIAYAALMGESALD